MRLSTSEAAHFYDAQHSSVAALARGPSDTRYATDLLRLLAAKRLIDRRAIATYLDLGCGLGFKTIAVARGLERTVAIDVSVRAIEIARDVHRSTPVEFRVADAAHAELGERFDLVSAFGLSLLNADPVPQIVRITRSLVDQYVANGGYLLVVGQTDYSGEWREGWFCHTRDQLLSIASALDASLYFPQRDLRSYVGFGLRRLVRELGRRVRRRRSDWCLVVRHS
jgi:SAM-dependent methyltransferase